MLATDPLLPTRVSPNTNIFRLQQQRQQNNPQSSHSNNNYQSTDNADNGGYSLIDNNDNNNNNSDSYDSYLKRAFRPLLPGSLRGATFNLAASGVGAGILSLPLVFRNNGIILGGMLLLFGMIMTVYSLRLLMWCGNSVGATSYSETCERIYGRRLRIIFECCIIIYCFGTLVAYFLIIYTYIPLIIDIFEIQGFWANPTRDLCLFVGCLVFPLCLLKNISALRYASLASVVAIVYVAIAVAVRSIQYNINPDYINTFTEKHDDVKDDTKPIKPEVSLFIFNPSIFTSLSIVIFAFTCHVNAFSVYSELHNPTTKRMNKVITYTGLLEFTLYIWVAFFGYLQFGNTAASNILLNYSGYDIIMGIGRIAIVFTLLLHSPLQTFPALKTIQTTAKINSNIAHVGITAVMIGSALYLSIYVPELSIIFSLLGSTCSITICFIIPAICFLRLTSSNDQYWQLRLLVSILLFFVIIIGVVACSHILGEIIRGDALVGKR